MGNTSYLTPIFLLDRHYIAVFPNSNDGLLQIFNGIRIFDDAIQTLFDALGLISRFTADISQFRRGIIIDIQFWANSRLYSAFDSAENS